VLTAIHNGCIGGGVDLVSAADIRYCTEDAWFQLKETEIGLLNLGILFYSMIIIDILFFNHLIIFYFFLVVNFKFLAKTLK